MLARSFSSDIEGVAMHIERIEPETVRITVHGRARIRVQGRGYGSLRCAGQRRWVCGTFDETFRVENPADDSIDVVGTGLGRCRARIHWAPITDVSLPALPTLRLPQPQLPDLTIIPPTVPAVASLTAEQVWSAQVELVESAE